VLSEAIQLAAGPTSMQRRAPLRSARQPGRTRLSGTLSVEHPRQIRSCEIDSEEYTPQSLVGLSERGFSHGTGVMGG
jgi:hypothetical protein